MVLLFTIVFRTKNNQGRNEFFAYYKKKNLRGNSPNASGIDNDKKVINSLDSYYFSLLDQSTPRANLITDAL